MKRNDRGMSVFAATLSSTREDGLQHDMAAHSVLSRRQGSIFFSLLSGLYLSPYMRVLLPWSNEGTLASGAVRILRGEVFARDFFEVMGPGTFYLLAGTFKLLGATFFALRVHVFLVSWGTGLVVYALSRRWRDSSAVLPCLVLGATAYGLQWPGASHHVEGNFFALLAVSCMAAWHERPRAWLAVVSGALAAVTIFVHQPKGVLLVGALLIWLLLQIREGRPGGRAVCLVGAGFAVIMCAGLGYFWSRGALGALYAANVRWPLAHYGKVNEVRYGLGVVSEYWRHWAFQKSTLNGSTLLASFLIVPFLYVAALPGIVAVQWLMVRRRALTGLGGLYLVCGIALWFSEWHRHDIYHLVFASPLLLVVSLGLWSDTECRTAKMGRQLLAVTAGTLAVVNLLVAVTVHEVPTRVGRVGVSKDTRLLAALQAHTRRGEEIFVYPYRPLYYFLTNTVNPTRYLTLTYNYNTSAEFRDAIRTIEERRVRVVVWDRRFQTETAPKVFSSAAVSPPDGFLMEDYLRAHYREVEEIDGVSVMERRPE